MEYMYRFDNAGLNDFLDKGGFHAILSHIVGPLPFNLKVDGFKVIIETPNGNAATAGYIEPQFFKDLEPYMQAEKPSMSVSGIASELIKLLKAGAFTETPQGIKINETCYLTFVCGRDTPEKVRALKVFNGQTTRDDIFSCNDAQVLFHEYRQFKLAQEHEGREKQNFIKSLGF